MPSCPWGTPAAVGLDASDRLLPRLGVRCNNHRMPRFKRLTIDEARTLTRDQLLDRIEAEQKYWYRLMDSGKIRAGEDEAYKIFTQIMHAAIDPGRVISDTLALLNGESVNKDYWTKPLGELGDL